MNKKKAIPVGSQGFTLIELLLAIAIMVMLSGAILVSISSQREKARAIRMLSEVSAVMQPIFMCLADGGNINSPNGTVGGANICSISNAYGIWPKTTVSGFGNYVVSNSASFDNNSWYIQSNGSGARICCNSHMLNCEILGVAAACDATHP